MAKQESHNAFYYFMLDFKDRQGGKFPSLKEVAVAAGPHWQTLSKDKRKMYEQRANEARGALRQVKLNSDNVPVSEIEALEREEQLREEQMKDDIQATLSFAKRANTIDSHVFYIIHINSYCQNEHTKEYSPCELAIAGFSLKKGVEIENVYHTLIKPGPLPLGYAAAAFQHSNETHQIELPRFDAKETDNQREVFQEIHEFLNSKKKNSSEKYPPLYASDKHLPMVRQVFETWCLNNSQDTEMFQIYELQCMFRILYNTTLPAAKGHREWMSDTMSHKQIENDVYNFTPDTACEYHQVSDVMSFCSRSIAVRYAYIICDNCCQNLNIELIPGYHIPKNANVSPNTAGKSLGRPTSAKSKVSSDRTIREDSSDTETVMSIGRSSAYSSSSASVNFPELGRSLGRSSGQSVGASQDVASSEGLSAPEMILPLSGAGSYAGVASSSRSGCAGFSKRASALPFSVTEELSGMTLSQESRANNFPAIGVGRGRTALVNSVRGKGRGQPFKKPKS